jgi:hypothetical protein
VPGLEPNDYAPVRPSQGSIAARRVPPRHPPCCRSIYKCPTHTAKGSYTLYKHLIMKHLKEHNTTYPKHLGFALMLALRLHVLAIAGVIHAFIPYVFQKTVSHGVKELDIMFSEHIENPGGTD